MAQIITICAMPLVTRLYTPAQMGQLSLFLSFFLFWSATLSLRYEYAILIAKDDAESHVVHRLAMIIVVIMSMMGSPILWGLHQADALGFGLLPEWAALVVVPILLGYGVFMVDRSWILRAGAIKQITKATIAQSAAKCVARVVLGLAGGGIGGLFAAELASAWTGVFKLARGASKHFAPSRPAKITSRELQSVAKRFIKFGTMEAPSTWVNQLSLTFPVPMIAALFGAAEAGWFGLARMIVGIPNRQIGNAVADVFQMELANAVVSGDTAGARKLFYGLMRKLAVFGLLPMGFISISGPWFVPLVFGQEWGEAGYVVTIIAPWLYASLVVSPLSRALSVLQAQEYKLVYDICAILLFVIAFLLSKMQNFSFISAVVALSVAGILSYALYLIILIVLIENRLRPCAS
jgi:O-antigen/teichoic acid export membrane protein